MITAQEAKYQLRIVGTLDDSWLSMWIPIVTQMVEDWLKDLWRAYQCETDANGNHVLDSNGEPILLLDSNGQYIPRLQAKAACLLELDYRYTRRGGQRAIYTVDIADVPESWGRGHSLCKGATQVLAALRKPSLGGVSSND